MTDSANSALFKHLSQYAKYHQDRRNVATHFIGIPMIVIAVAILLSRPSLLLADVAITPALVLVVFCTIFYVRLHLLLGLFMGALLLVAVWLGIAAAQLPTVQWLLLGVGLFALGWLLQFIGHYFEGKKPAFMDDMRGLIIGPLFVVVEAILLFGFKSDWHQKINQP